MNRDTVIDLAKQAKVFFDDRRVNYCFYPNQLLEFAALVAAHEREECAKVAKQWDSDHPSTNYGGCIANLIRSRE